MESITNEEFKRAEERTREEYLKLKQAKRFRITSGGNFKDFENEEDAFKYFQKKVLRYSYASMNIVYPKLFQIEVEAIDG